MEETLEYREDEILSAFKDDFLYVEIKKEFKIKYDLSLLKKEQSIKGEFIRNALTYLSGKDDDYISDVIEYGVKNL